MSIWSVVIRVKTLLQNLKIFVLLLILLKLPTQQPSILEYMPMLYNLVWLIQQQNFLRSSSTASGGVCAIWGLWIIFSVLHFNFICKVLIYLHNVVLIVHGFISSCPLFFSSLGQGLMTSTHVSEIIFAIFIAVFGLVLFSFLIGNMQVILF